MEMQGRTGDEERIRMTFMKGGEVRSKIVFRSKGLVQRAARKRISCLQARFLAFSLTLFTALGSNAAWALPHGGSIVSGSGKILSSKGGTLLTVQQNSPTLSLNWSSFNISNKQTIVFDQPSFSSVALNYIGGTSASQIFGNLKSVGQVYLINPFGIVFGKDAKVNVGGLVAAAMDLQKNGFGKTLEFSGTGTVENAGTIRALAGGSVILLGQKVKNTGTISAANGVIALGAGTQISLDFSGNDLVDLVVDQKTAQDVIDNGGILAANGGKIILKPEAQKTLVASVINNAGNLEAQGIAEKNGKIVLSGLESQTGESLSKKSGTSDNTPLPVINTTPTLTLEKTSGSNDKGGGASSSAKDTGNDDSTQSSPGTTTSLKDVGGDDGSKSLNTGGTSSGGSSSGGTSSGGPSSGGTSSGGSPSSKDIGNDDGNTLADVGGDDGKKSSSQPPPTTPPSLNDDGNTLADTGGDDGKKSTSQPPPTTPPSLNDDGNTLADTGGDDGKKSSSQPPPTTPPSLNDDGNTLADTGGDDGKKSTSQPPPTTPPSLNDDGNTLADTGGDDSNKTASVRSITPQSPSPSPEPSPLTPPPDNLPTATLINASNGIQGVDGNALGGYGGGFYLANSGMNGFTSSDLIIMDGGVKRLGTINSSGSFPFTSHQHRRNQYFSAVDQILFQSPENRHLHALVIGVERYSLGIQAAPFANRDAEIVSQYFLALGVPPENIQKLMDTNATRDQINSSLKWLGKNVKAGETVYVYYSGHGSPGANGEAYIVPSDGNPSNLQKTGISIKSLFESLNKLPARHVVLLMDTGFNGHGNRSILGKEASPQMTKIHFGKLPSSGKVIAFSSAKPDQESGILKSEGHGLFTYYFLKGLDKGGVQKGHVTLATLYKYLEPKVVDMARSEKEKQTPLLEPNLTKDGTLRFR